MISMRSLRCLAFVSTWVCTLPASAQICTPDWETFHVPGPGRDVYALAEHDDGSGNALYVGGSGLHTGGGSPNYGLMRWRGSGLEPLHDGTVYALTSFDEGVGPRLFLGGQLSQAGSAFPVLRWNGSTFTGVGPSSSSTALVFALQEFDDGTGPALYAGGLFTSIGGVAASNIARWNGSSWSPLGSGVSWYVKALCVFDDGSGPRLYVGGWFTQAGGIPAAKVARWSAAGWEAVGSGLISNVSSLAVFDAGSGPHLYASYAAGSPASVWRLDGASWTSVGDTPSQIDVLHVERLLGVDRLVAGGSFTTLGGASASRIVAYDGNSWTALGAGLLGWAQMRCSALAGFDPGSGRKLYAGGVFLAAGSVGANALAGWDGHEWSGIAPATAPSGPLTLLARADLGATPRLVVGGLFDAAGTIAAKNIALWDGRTWSALGSGTNATPAAAATFDDGSGPALYVGGGFTQAGGIPVSSVARWNGSSWSNVGAGLDVFVLTLAVHDDGTGPALYAGGYFTTSGSTPVLRVARWDGSQWQPLGTGFDSNVNALVSFDDGSGTMLYAAGAFSSAGGVAASSVARWNGTSWSPVGAGLTDGVGGYPPTAFTLCVHDDGSGPHLYAGGQFTRSGPTFTNGVARWDGSAWQATPAGAPGEVSAMTSWRTASGPVLVATFYTSSASPRLIQLSGGTWSYFAGSLFSGANSMLGFDTGSSGGEELYLATSGNTAGGVASDFLAALHGCALDGAPYCAGDGQDPAVTTPCPCANFGGPGRGCANSVQSRGALLSVFGATAQDDVALVCTSMPLTAPCVFLKGDASVAGGVVFGDGVRCVGGNLIRLGTLLTSGGSARYPGAGMASVSTRGGTPPGSGLFASYQVYYRNAATAFCPPLNFNVSNGWQLVW